MWRSKVVQLNGEPFRGTKAFFEPIQKCLLEAVAEHERNASAPPFCSAERTASIVERHWPLASENEHIRAQAPLAQMFGYSTDLRSATQGRATYTMEFDKYAVVPNNIAEGIINHTS